MRVAVLSDIHGNRHAFEAVLAEVAEAEVEEMWCLGDLVGYGAEPDACVALAAEHADLCLVGNHDLAVRGDIPLEQFSKGAAGGGHDTGGGPAGCRRTDYDIGGAGAAIRRANLPDSLAERLFYGQ